MKKIINNPYECGYCNVEENYRDTVCKHPKNIKGVCDNVQIFPKECPLKNQLQTEDKIAEYIEKYRYSKSMTSHRLARHILDENQFTEQNSFIDCKFFDEAQGRNKCVHKDMAGRCFGICLKFEK